MNVSGEIFPSPAPEPGKKERPFQIFLLGSADLMVFLILGAFLIGVLVEGTWPFRAMMGTLVALFVAQWGYMIASVIHPREVGYYDHGFFYVPLFGALSRPHSLLFFPLLMTWGIMLLKPAVRRYFGLPLVRWAILQLPEGVLLFLMLIGCVGVRCAVDNGFPLFHGDMGGLSFLREEWAPIMLGIVGATLAVMVWKGWKLAFYPAVLFVGLILLPYYSRGFLLGTVFCGFWFLPENRRFFGLTEKNRLHVCLGICLWMSFVGIIQAWIPVGRCAKHHQPLYLYSAWETPLLAFARREETIYKNAHPSASEKVQANCSWCERALVCRNETAACRNNRYRIRDAVLRRLNRVPGRAAPELILWRPQGMTFGILNVGGSEKTASCPAGGADHEALRELLSRTLPFPCPFEARVAGDAGKPVSGTGEYRFVVSPPGPSFPTGDVEGACAFCDVYGF